MASMRPRPEGRGEPDLAGREPRRVARLQCGHDPKAVENRASTGCGAGKHNASMRPRPEGRGERREGPTAAEIAALQCGHDPKAVENRVGRLDPPRPRRRFNAATTRRPWRTEAGRDRADRRPAASMRPRPEGRGEPRPWPAFSPRCVASMRPRPEGRGEPAATKGFGIQMVAGFNAATTRRPWRTGQCTDGGGLRQSASMRPRPEGRGELLGSAALTRLCRFNAATTRRPWRTRLLVAVPDHRRRVGSFNAATTRRPWRTRPNALSASLVRRFNAATTRRPWRTAATVGRTDSSRRSSFNAATTRRPWRTPGGAFGSATSDTRFNAATTRRPWRTLVAVVDLRPAGRASMRPRPEGRGEPDAGRRPDVACRSFNAATTRRPWRTRQRQAGQGVGAVASMRPRPEGRGEPAAAGTGRPPASMRPRPEGRGELARSSRYAGRPRSFNAATTRMPWRTNRVQRSGFVCTAELQCGHDPNAVENASVSSMKRRPSGASMRPRPECRGEHWSGVHGPGVCVGFNAATARMPWRTSGRIGMHSRWLEASMRPRPECRGELSPGAGCRAVRTLQCGHGPNAVENSARRPPPPPRGALQCGHGPNSPWRTSCPLAGRHASARASMRPRRIRRGECGGGGAPSASSASMRPRPNSPWRTARRPS